MSTITWGNIHAELNHLARIQHDYPYNIHITHIPGQEMFELSWGEMCIQFIPQRDGIVVWTSNYKIEDEVKFIVFPKEIARAVFKRLKAEGMTLTKWQYAKNAGWIRPDDN